MFFKPQVSVDGIRVLVDEARTNPLSPQTADAVFWVGGGLNAFRGADDTPVPVGDAGPDDDFSIPEDTEDLCRKIEARLPYEPDKEEGVKSTESTLTELVSPVVLVLVRALIARLLKQLPNSL